MKNIDAADIKIYLSQTTRRTMLVSDQIHITGKLHDIDNIPHKGDCWIHNSKGEKIAKVKTRKDGTFEARLDNAKLFPNQKYSSQKVMKENLTFRILKNQESKMQETVHKITLQADQCNINAGTIQMDHITQKESPPASYLLRIAKVTVEASLRGSLETGKNHLFGTSIETLREDYGIAPHDVTEENFIKFVLNGIPSLEFKPEGRYLTAEVNWDDIEFDQQNNLANVKIFLLKDSVVGRVRLRKFELQYRQTLEASDRLEDKGPVLTYRPEKKDFVEGAKNALAALHLYGQCSKHLADHKYGVYVAQAALDHLEGTIIGKFVLPMCTLVRTITDQLAINAISGESGILNRAAPNVKGINTKLTNAQMMVDPFKDILKEEINEGHTYAIGYNIFYRGMKEMFAQFTGENWDKIKSEWKSMHEFFARLHITSPLYLPKQGFESIEDENLPKRTKHNEEDEAVRSMRPVAVNPDAPAEDDREMMVRFFAHMLTTLTFDHSWEHYSQFASTADAPSADDPDFSPIAPQTDIKAPCAGMTFDDTIAQMTTSKIFKDFSNEKEYLLLNCSWVHPMMKEAVNKMATELKARSRFDVREKLLFTICI